MITVLHGPELSFDSGDPTVQIFAWTAVIEVPLLKRPGWPAKADFQLPADVIIAAPGDAAFGVSLFDQVAFGIEQPDLSSAFGMLHAYLVTHQVVGVME